jgi:tRNA-modifying protein YgfZ
MVESEDKGQLERDAALVDVGELEIVQATGGDRVSFLHRLLTADVEGTAVGGGCRSLLLTVKGHIVVDLRLFVRPEEVRLVVPPGQATATAEALSRYAIMDDFNARPEPRWRLRALYGPRAPDRLSAAGITLPQELGTRPLWSHLDADSPVGPLWVVRAQGYGTEGLWLWCQDQAARAELDRRLEAAGIPRLHPQVAEALRILAGEPTAGAEITSDYFPMEVGLSAAIDYAKGCFLGQEPIVRIRDRGHINWRLVGLRLRESAEVQPGDRLEADVKPKAGRLTSVAQLPGEHPVALGLLHLSVPAGTEVRVRHGDSAIAAEVVALSERA